MKEDDSTLRESLLSTNTQGSLNQPSIIKAKPRKVNGSTIFQQSLFTWVYSMLRVGSKRPITLEDMPTLPPKLQTDCQYHKLAESFERATLSKTEGVTLIKAIFRAFARPFLLMLLFAFLFVIVTMANPYLTKVMMDYISHRSDYSSSYGWWLLLATVALQILKTLFDTHMTFQFTQLGMNITNSLTMLIYNKSLKFSPLTEKQFPQADIINYSQVDAERIAGAGYMMATIIMTPLQIIIGIVLMYWFIGASFLAGFGTIILVLIATYFLSKWSVRLNKELLKLKDLRMRATREFLDIIRFIKITTIEKFFYRKVDQRRLDQVQLYRTKGLAMVLSIFLFWVSSPLILSATFFTYIKLGYQISSGVAFTTIMIFNTLAWPLRLLPTSISNMIENYTSIKRIEKYLMAQQIDSSHVKYNQSMDNDIAIKIEGGNFYWGRQIKDEDKRKDKKGKENKKSKKVIKQQQTQSKLQANEEQKSSRPQEIVDYNQLFVGGCKIDESVPEYSRPKYDHALKDINLQIKKGCFTLLLGDIGSGKSSMLLAILNQMRAARGSSIEINGNIAYASQKPWILSGTVRENITFSFPFNQELFEKAIRLSALEKDLEILPKGVETEIGEKGVNLSGGQKARIGLARALYSQKDIYLLDDILSAVDVHVGQFLMRQTLLGELKGKTIVMPTHAIKFAQTADDLLVLNKGRIMRQGHYRDICQTEQFKSLSSEEEKKENAGESAKESDTAEAEMAMIKQAMKKNESQDYEVKGVEDKIVAELMLPQDHKVGKIDFKIFKEFISLNGGFFKFILPVVFSMVLWGVFNIGSSIVMEKWCESPFDHDYYLYLYIGLSIFSAVFIFIRAYILILSSARQGQIVHRKMIKSLLYASLGRFFNRVPVGRIINRLTKDLRELDEAVGTAMGNFVVSIFGLSSTLIICIYGSTWLVFLPMLIVLFLCYFTRQFYMKTQRQVARFEKSTNSPIITGFLSAISGLATIRAYQNSDKFFNKQMTALDANKRVRLNKSGLESWFTISLTFLSLLVNMSAVGYCLLSSNKNASLAGLLMTYALSLSDDILWFTFGYAYFQTKIISLQRVYTFTKIEPEPAYEQYCLDWSPEEEARTQAITHGAIQFKMLGVRYRPDLPNVLKQVNCKIEAGEKVGVVGRTGAGKTTIINTLLGITEITSGDVYIDGKSLSDYHLKDIRNGVTMIDQEPTLIKASFRQNLDLTGKYQDAELHAILKECNLLEIVTQKGGLDAQVSNDTLSAGQKQLLCICRAFLKHSRIVLVDEATASIDLRNDALIQQVIKDKFAECTVLTIAHRLSTLEHSDKIVVMEAGRIVQFGTPQQLAAQEGGFYREMVLKNAEQFLV